MFRSASYWRERRNYVEYNYTGTRQKRTRANGIALPRRWKKDGDARPKRRRCVSEITGGSVSEMTDERDRRRGRRCPKRRENASEMTERFDLCDGRTWPKRRENLTESTEKRARDDADLRTLQLMYEEIMHRRIKNLTSKSFRIRYSLAG